MKSEECPKCRQDLGIAISRYFWTSVIGSMDASEFKFECPNCHSTMRVSVESVPMFTIAKPVLDE
ncbi:MAG: hypothetical protein WC107_05735 [Patescibacteria group bacterium]|jgi:Zn finger protein HypA/HybF involved in hydrogenase expression